MDLEIIASACSALTSAAPDFFSESGGSWLAGRYNDTMYNHVMIPNWQSVDRGPPPDRSRRLHGSRSHACRLSNHSGGARVSYD